VKGWPVLDIFTKCKAFTTANEIREQGIYPYFHALESRQDIEVMMEGKRRIMLGSNNYLGLTTNPEVIEAGIQALKKYGTGCSGSRFLNGTLVIHLELEAEFGGLYRNRVGRLIFPQVFRQTWHYQSAIVAHGDYVVCDRENHASIYDGCKLSYGKMLRYKHSDMAELEKS
jgi:7-keto-8-aminopelargonate synthetase-like enzyme